MVEKTPKGRASAASATSRNRRRSLRGLVWAFRFQADGTIKELAVDEPIADHRDGRLWLHFHLTDQEASRSLETLGDLPQSARRALIAADDHPQLHAEGGCVYGVFADIVRDGTDLEIGFVHFAMTERLLVSCRRQLMNTGDSIRQVLQKGPKVTTVAALFAAIVEHVVDAVDDYADDIAENLSDIEERILADEVSDERQALGRLRRTTVQLHRQLGMSHSLIRHLERDDVLPAKSELRLATTRVDHRLTCLDTEIVALRDRAHLLQEEVTLKLAERTNRHLEVLSIVATVFLPATLVAGVFGMNVKGLPLTQTDYGFDLSIVLIFGISAVVFWLLRRSGVVGG
jgi:zinc transporter